MHVTRDEMNPNLNEMSVTLCVFRAIKDTAYVLPTTSRE